MSHVLQQPMTVPSSRLLRATRRGAAIVAALTLGAGACSERPVGPLVDAGQPTGLVLVADSSVTVETTPGGTQFAAGTAVQYRVRSRPGYGRALVVLDSIVVSDTGTVVARDGQMLFASAGPLQTRLPASDRLLGALTVTLTSPQPEFGYQTYLDELARLAATVSGGSVARHLEAAENTIARSPSLAARQIAVDSALGGHVFEWRPPSVPSPLRVLESTERAGLAADPSSQARLAFVFTNGIRNALGEAGESMLRLMQIASDAGYPPSARTAFLLNYSPSLKGGQNQCEDRLLAALQRDPAWVMATLRLNNQQWKAEVEAKLGCSYDKDKDEVWQQIRHNVDQVVQTPVHGASLQLQQTLTMLHDRGFVVINMAHSQGNLMSTEALSGFPKVNDGPGICTSHIGIAAPGPQHLGTAAPTTLIVAAGSEVHDFVLDFAPSGARTYETPLTHTYDVLWWVLRPVFLHPIVNAIGSLHLHGLSQYTTAGPTRMAIADAMRAHYERLAADCRGAFQGTVVDGKTKVAIGGATVTVIAPNAPAVVATGGADGTFKTPSVPLWPARVEITAPTYDTLRLYGREALIQGRTQLGTLALYRTTDSVTLTGRAIDVTTNAGVRSASVTVRAGADATDGAGLATTSTDADGGFTVRLKVGTYTLSATAVNYKASAPVVLSLTPGTQPTATLRLTPANTGDFTGAWLYNDYCGSSLGTVVAEMRLTQRENAVSGTMQITNSAEGGAKWTLDGLVSGRTLTGNSVAWLIPHEGWTLNRGWTISLAADGNAITGAAPISGCPQSGWRRLSAPSVAGVRAPAAATPAVSHQAPSDGGSMLGIRPRGR